ncbi:SDR family NAD(P)-dependent oxidoreductase [Microbacterium oleivorans]|uniref:SDR family NAD(P)-dependent oxidoreductase n=1 Tax=Microbacterium oleivorans TaxID=273677 RepID=UPI002041BD89|nr:SDR family NAD(P)-dependent oxidoreductase [Microbacterium oleivorans]MCM3697407.1 SDR family NAD(P)-dependent oxidoreductase [Microbacterium oleivorans]
MSRTALVTGASSGIGAEYARQLSSRGAEVVLVGRDESALRSLADEIGARGGRADVLVTDLLDAAQRSRVEERLAAGVDVLVNCAGYGLRRAFEESDIDDEARHLELHAEVTMRLTRAALPVMLDRRRGRILNVASVAGLVPRGTYGAAKAWVVSFSRWADAVYAPRGVTVTAVCPGFVHTNFHERLGLPPGQEGVPGWMWLDAPAVVRASLRDAARGRAVSIPSFRYKALVALSRLLPDRVVVPAASRGR